MVQYAGIDISKWNANLDYYALKKAKINGRKLKFAMLRISYGKSLDTSFSTHYSGCKKAGIYVGAYHWLRASNPEDAADEARWLLRQLKNYSLDYPIALDFEDEQLLGMGLSKEQYTEIAEAFLGVLKAENYYAILYTNPNVLENYLSDNIRRDHDIWLAHWVKEPKQYGQKMWQYAALGTENDVQSGYATAEGEVKGANGPIDVNISYIGYAALIKKLGMNKPLARYLLTAEKSIPRSDLGATTEQLSAIGFRIVKKQLR